MSPIGINPSLIPIIYQWGIFLLCVMMFIVYSGSTTSERLLQKRERITSAALVIALIFFIGLRPVSSVFGDTVNYAHTYNLQMTDASSGVNVKEINASTEWVYSLYEDLCHMFGLSVNTYLFWIEVGYLGFMYWAFRKSLWENTWFAMLFALSAFSVFTYGVNGLRNGLACSMATLAIVYAAKDKNYFVSIILGIIALGTHRSTILPFTALALALTLVRSPRAALWIWLTSIPLSLTVGESITQYLSGFDFDQRVHDYLSGENLQYGTFAYVGFRWDFLIYSAMPVLLIWYVQNKIAECPDNFDDDNPQGTGVIADAQSMRVWNVISIVYLLTNAFWIVVCRAAFSNRFAYLSWFIYPLVVAYAVIRLHLWQDQDRKAGLILLLHSGFTFAMFMIGKL